MTKIPYEEPEFQKTSFNCPFCNAFAKQSWAQLEYFASGHPDLPGSFVCFCSHCKKFSIWHNEKMVYPDFSGVEPPSEDLDADISRDYEEAVSILQKSPRGSAALLRLAIQKICIDLSGKKNLNDAIAELVKEGLPRKVQQSMDTLRVIGNEAIHPGQLDLRDDSETAGALFRLLNFIAEKMITEPKTIDAIYEKIPEEQKEQIKQRDGNNDE